MPPFMAFCTYLGSGAEAANVTENSFTSCRLSSRTISDGWASRSGTGTLEIYFLSRFGAAILVNIRLNSARRSLNNSWIRARPPLGSNQYRSAISNKSIKRSHHGKHNQEHHFCRDGGRCSLRGNGFRPPVVAGCSGHNLPAPFLHQDITLPQCSGLRMRLQQPHCHLRRMRVHCSQIRTITARVAHPYRCSFRKPGRRAFFCIEENAPSALWVFGFLRVPIRASSNDWNRRMPRSQTAHGLPADAL